MKIQVFKSTKNKQWYFRIVANNGKTVAQSEGYKRKKDAISTATKCKEIWFQVDVEVLK